MSQMQCEHVRKFGVFWNEAKVNNSHVVTTLLYQSCTFALTFTQSEASIYTLQTAHLKIKNPKNLREVIS